MVTKIEFLDKGSHSGGGICLPELFWGTVFFLLEYPIKVRKVIKSALIGDLSNTVSCFN